MVFGRDMLGYDVRGGKLYINEQGAKTVRLIFEKFANEKKGTHVISRELREEGIETSKHMKKWSNSAILRVIRNEKYCGDLIQKKTYTPNYLSHEKKKNRGEENFIIHKNHHEPIVSREIFEKANAILNSRSASQKNKSKYSNRYSFSGKIKCGCCGMSYVARSKKRKDGSRYQLWRCFEASRHGSAHIDSAGNRIGCNGESIRNEDAQQILRLICMMLDCEKELLIKNMLYLIRRAAFPVKSKTGTGGQDKITRLREKRARLIDIYTNGNISKEEFICARKDCDAELKKINETENSIFENKAQSEEERKVLRDIERTLSAILYGMEADDEFYKNILEKMIVHDRGHIDVHLKQFPFKWEFKREEA